MSLSFKTFLKEYAKGSGGEGDDPTLYPYLIRHNPDMRHSWISMAIVGGGPATPIELHDLASKIAKYGQPLSIAQMTMSRAHQIHELYEKEPDYARDLLLGHIESTYDPSGKKTRYDRSQPHPYHDSLGKLSSGS